ncbi:MAG: hypothetical protein KJO40_08895 [Deltaproteobacteria bacterium]|nr:hypothetical protein [Deltaproteobacteria bacterium]NND29433.1 hypothetical protein [Myxococcales bacterium]MBT8463399.1 hypothetical protein [Deltaproteobacteria bacterium]MBT8480693.1 hypothetical protein [Deltaproteobacteria bacterium]NNK09136.1 hypothetical protein [Myxococcales bacterium]
MGRDVGVDQLVQELERRGDRLPFEIGAFVALEACEGLLLEAVKLDADDVRVTLEGSVVVSNEAERVDPDEAARSLVSVLARLLVAAGPGVPPHLLQLVKESTTGQNPRDLRHLHDAIEASLIPINRGASRRVLARLVRESDRPPVAEPASVDPRELDTELQELLRDPATRDLESRSDASRTAQAPAEEPITEQIRIPSALSRKAQLDEQPETVPVPPSRPAVSERSTSAPDPRAPSAADTAAAADAARQRAVQQEPEPVTATIRKWSSEEESGSAPVSASKPVSAPVSASKPVSQPAKPTRSETLLETPTESVFGTGSVSHAESVPSPLPVRESAAAPEPTYEQRSSAVPAPPKRRGGLGVLLAAAAVGLGLYALISTGTLDALVRPAPGPVASFTPGVIEITVTPSDAQIFVFVGRGPAIADGLEAEQAHEFVVFDHDLRPSRAIVPEGASWTTTDEGLLYELAVQAEPADNPTEELDFGEAQSKPSSVRATGSARVRVITNPPGAKVYRYVGLGPRLRILAGSIQEGHEILVFHPEHEIRRGVIGPSDWQMAKGETAQSAALDVELPALPTSAAPEPLED